MTHSQKGISSLAIILLFALLAVGGGYFYTSSKKTPSTPLSSAPETHMMSDNTVMEGVGAEQMEKMMNNESKTPSKYFGEILAGKDSPLIDFNKKDYDQALLEGKPILLYFYASWCPICREETANALYPAFNALKEETVVGFRVNYKDSDTDKSEEMLAKQFGVAYQHTKVLLKNGKQVVKSPESWDKARYIKEINSL
ncbi:MAG: thioredoxin family protein [Patescibacteria group bacterium]